MTAKAEQNFDCLRELARDQLNQLHRFGPIVFEIFEILQNSNAPMPIDPLIERVLAHRKIVLRCDADALNLRAGPSLQSPIIKLVERGAQLLLSDPAEQGKIGKPGAWLHVVDLEGDRGYVVGQYVSLDHDYSSPPAKVEALMFTLESFDRMDLVAIDPNLGVVKLTNKGENVARTLMYSD
ncbi:MAG TPA: SH3 domain-containing protein [Levilinea sp.]|nr:SH3 domain-containing protein [Levilinea sp.]